ncbi:hypothetical protein B0T16DRAFT_456128 [Cercophora newfieldiana]|uniref:Uncharacterized protein n=1 Tax=Cercophora newfieldiana TaxID=92897 RepID=A0AA40CS42_9PEZI|nr:hypothetical protein B0T16DRAFT_456128 [Cercophora newfieldiana]
MAPSPTLYEHIHAHLSSKFISKDVSELTISTFLNILTSASDVPKVIFRTTPPNHDPPAPRSLSKKEKGKKQVSFPSDPSELEKVLEVSQDHLHYNSTSTATFKPTPIGLQFHTPFPSDVTITHPPAPTSSPPGQGTASARPSRCSPSPPLPQPGPAPSPASPWPPALGSPSV